MGPRETGERRRRLRRDEETRLRQIIDHVADGILIVNSQGMVRFTNPAAAELFGRPVDELLDQPFGFPLVAQGTTEIDVVRRSGETRVAELRVVEMEWERKPAMLVSLRDITDRRQAEESLRQLIQEQAARSRAEEEEQRARFMAEAGALLDSSLDYQVVLNQLARLVVAPERELPFPSSPRGSLPSLADWCVIDVFGPGGDLARVAVAHRDPAREPLLQELRQRFPPSLELPYPGTGALQTRRAQLFREMSAETLSTLTRGPEHQSLLRRLGIASAMAVPLTARGELLGVILFVRGEGRFSDSDLSLAQELAHRSSLAIANARLYGEAQRANRAKADFLAVMSHELRTPLNAIIGYTDLLAAEITGPLSQKQKEQLARIDGSSRHLLQIVEEILTFARMEAGREAVHAARTDLGDLVEEVSSMVQPLAQQKGLDFEVGVPERPVVVETDPGKVRQILLNLLSNAVKFTDRGRVRVTAQRDGGDYLVRVSDTGIGIAEDHLANIFEPFWQVDGGRTRRAEGTGLGLSVARRLAETLGGSLQAESRLGGGTTFTLRLPPTPANAARPRAGEPV